MTRAAAIFAAIVVCLSATTAAADAFEFPLPEFAGMSADTSLTATFTYTGFNGNVDGVRVRVVGTVDYIGLIACMSEPPDTSAWPLDIGSWVQKPGDTGYWRGFPGFLDQLGPFDLTYQHYTTNGGFTTINNGDVVQVDLYFYPAALVGICGPIDGPSTGTLTQVSVLLDVTPPVPVEKSTWGAVKSLFR